MNQQRAHSKLGMTIIESILAIAATSIAITITVKSVARLNVEMNDLERRVELQQMRDYVTNKMSCQQTTVSLTGGTVIAPYFCTTFPSYGTSLCRIRDSSGATLVENGSPSVTTVGSYQYRARCSTFVTNTTPPSSQNVGSHIITVEYIPLGGSWSSAKKLFDTAPLSCGVTQWCNYYYNPVIPLNRIYAGVNYYNSNLNDAGHTYPNGPPFAYGNGGAIPTSNGLFHTSLCSDMGMNPGPPGSTGSMGSCSDNGILTKTGNKYDAVNCCASNSYTRWISCNRAFASRP